MQRRPEASQEISTPISASMDRICDQFESAWRHALSKNAPRPRIEDYLPRVAVTEREPLLRELLLVELQVLQAAGETPAPDGYLVRFPGDDHVVAAAFSQVEQTPKRVGPYELLQELGNGGMGTVYRARHVLLHQEVALKVLRGRLLNDPQALSRFHREMRSAGALKHPNVVHAHNAGHDQGRHFLVMELVDGETLLETVTRNDHIPIGAACEMIRQAALGLQHIDERGLVHRDIKPSNLMLDRGGVVRILDLGLARLQEVQPPGEATEGITVEGVTLGTVDYMAPEQCESPRGVGIQADIYSLGCTLFHLATGRPPYSGGSYDTRRKKLMAHIVAGVPRLGEICPDCPATVAAIVSRMMAKEPHERFERPADVAEAIEPFADRAQLLEIAAQIGVRKNDAETAPRSALLETGIGYKNFPGDSHPTVRQATSHVRLRGARVVVALLVLAVFAAVAWWVARRDSPAATPDSQTALITLPGLTGRWWFDETPWMTPSFRAALASPVMHSAQDTAGENAAGAIDVLSPDVARLHARLRSAFEAHSRVMETTAPSRARAVNAVLFYLERERLSETELQTMLEAATSLNDPHLAALLRHKFDMPDTEAAYEQAIKGYQASLAAGADPILRGLYALCLLDLARWHMHKHEYAEAASTCAQARGVATAAGGGSPLFTIVTLCQESIALRPLARTGREWDEVDHLLSEAFRTAKRHLDNSHPLIAYLHERRAWARMDQWRVTEARADFEAALDLRRRALEAKPSSYDPAYAEAQALHNEHGLAMVERFSGNSAESQRRYADLYHSLLKRLEEADDPPDDFVGRLVNTAERLADSYLFARTPEPTRAGGLLDEAFEWSETRRAVTTASGDTSAGRAQLLAKRAIASALLGDEAAVSRLEQALDEFILSPEQQEDLRPYRATARAIVSLVDPTQRESARATLRDLIRRIASGEYSGAEEPHDRGLRRHQLELLLLAWTQLVESRLSGDAADDPAPPLAEDLSLVFSVRPPELRDPAALGFLRPYYDLALQAETALGQEEVSVKLLRHVRMAATGKNVPWRPRTPVLAMYPFGSGGVLILLHRPDQEIEIFQAEGPASSPQASEPPKRPLPKAVRQRLEAIDEPIEAFWYGETPSPFELPEHVATAAVP